MNNIKKKLESIGLDCRFDTAVFGRYYDGIDHEFTCVAAGREAIA